MRQLLFMAMLMISLCSLVSGQDLPRLRQSLEANNQSFVEAFNRGDAAAVTSMYTRDARLMPANSPIIANHLGIRTYWQEAINAGLKLVSLKTLKVEACGNTAYEIGLATLTVPKAGGVTTTDYAKYIVVWKREGRRWKLAVDSFSSNLATPGQ